VVVPVQVGAREGVKGRADARVGFGYRYGQPSENQGSITMITIDGGSIADALAKPRGL
jgi:hypothetical protein